LGFAGMKRIRKDRLCFGMHSVRSRERFSIIA
jgi:hypothetical protein